MRHHSTTHISTDKHKHTIRPTTNILIMILCFLQLGMILQSQQINTILVLHHMHAQTNTHQTYNINKAPTITHHKSPI